MKFLSVIFAVSLCLSFLVSANADPLVKFSVTSDNITCILAEFSGKLTLQNITFNVNGTVDTEASNCGADSQVLSIDNYDGSSIAFTFGQTNTSVMLTSVIFMDDNVTYSSDSSESLFTVATGNSYKCDEGLTTDLKNNGTSVKLELKSVRINAFRTIPGSEFQSDSVCSGDGWGNKTVPMIIAFVLAGMVVIMLVGYIILRKREDRTTYQTV